MAVARTWFKTIIHLDHYEKRLKIFPCRIQIQQALTNVDKDRRVILCDSFRQYLEDNQQLFTTYGSLTKLNST
jgi:hypothetical protein